MSCPGIPSEAEGPGEGREKEGIRKAMEERERERDEEVTMAGAAGRAQGDSCLRLWDLEGAILARRDTSQLPPQTLPTREAEMRAVLFFLCKE